MTRCRGRGDPAAGSIVSLPPFQREIRSASPTTAAQCDSRK